MKSTLLVWFGFVSLERRVEGSLGLCIFLYEPINKTNNPENVRAFESQDNVLLSVLVVFA
jgi:hypothetical protein